MKSRPSKEQRVSAWLRIADSDLRLAEVAASLEDPPGDLASFHAQQCAEKYLKGALTFLRIGFPKTHDLSELCRMLSPQWPDMPLTASEVAELTDYAVASRYPDEWEEITPSEIRQAIDMAKRVREAVLAFLKTKGWNDARESSGEKP